MEKKGEVDKFSMIGRIENGTVLDHIPGGQALNVLRILKIEAGTDRTISVGTNVPSKSMVRKDIFKIEGRQLAMLETHKIAIVAPHATINEIRCGKLVKKMEVKLPRMIEGIIRCGNFTCITNSKEPLEPVTTKFYPIDPEDDNTSFQCHYCRQIIDHADAIKAII